MVFPCFRAQRLSASEGKTASIAPARNSAGFCAQRLSASEGKTEVLEIFGINNRNVLNAFRHQRGKQQYMGSKNRIAKQCSTPFGIRGENRAYSGFSPNMPRYGAQRLSASEGKTGKISLSNLTKGECSTPFGIRGENSGFVREGGASGLPLCAQRLSASEGKTGDLTLRYDGDTAVLNAFRHQRGKQALQTVFFMPLV